MRASKSRKNKEKSGLQGMRDVVVAIVLLGALAGLVHLLTTRSQQVLRGRATVQDGDSLRLGQIRLRLSGIDAPELSQTCRANGARSHCGRMARAHLVALTADRPVNCTGSQQDRFGRLLVRCATGGIDLNRTMVRDGWAVSFDDFPAEEAEAREAGRGLWSGEFMAPADWRRSHERSGEPKPGRDFSPDAMIENLHRRILRWLRP